MSTVLGIDTGGTFTDGVIIDLSSKKVLEAVKSPTTHQDLMIGIRETIHKLSADHLNTVSYVGISTTLATNAIVENRGCRVGLLMLGYESEQELPQCQYYVLPGKFNIRGEETEPLDVEKIHETISKLQYKVDAVAISGICSVRNPKHEETVKKLVRELLRVPVVMAHELSTALGVHERTVTSVLNARLVFVIDNLLHGIKQVLSECGLSVPIMVVKGDGSLMNEKITRERPIETILSGPAASIIGATYLNGSTDGVVLDMGGTTTDIAILKNGLPRLDAEGAKVGGWKTRVAAVEVTTSGLGGDSRIRLKKNGNIEIGPCRNVPISVICKKYQSYLEEVEYSSFHPTGLVFNEAYEGYFLLHSPSSHLKLTELQQKVVAAVTDAPHTVPEISRRIGVDANLIPFDDLLENGILGAVGFTPTDVLCLEGLYRAGKDEGASMAGNLLAKKAGLPLNEFIVKVKTAVTDKLCRAILDSALTYEKVEIDPFHSDKVLEYFFCSAIWGKADAIISNGFQLCLPMIGIGAPTRFWLPAAADKFQTEAVFSEYHHVANAVGAAVGKVMRIFHVVVQNHEAAGIYIYAPWGQTKLKPAVNNEDRVMDRAVNAAIAKGKAIIAKEMQEQKIGKYDVLIDRKDSKVRIGDGDDLCIETHLEIVAAGHLENIDQTSKHKSLLGVFWGQDKTPNYTKLPTVT